MTFEDFLQNVKSAVDQKLPDGISLQYRNIRKNNEVSLTGACISRPENGKSCQVIYMDPLYRMMEDDREIRLIADLILHQIETPVPERIQKIRVESYEDVRDSIIVRLISLDRNRNRLKNLVYREFLDMAVSCCILFSGPETGWGLTEISREMAEKWGVTEEELYSRAMENMPRLMPDTLRTLREAALLCSEEDSSTDHLYVLSNESAYCGAAAILYTDKLAALAEKYETDLYLMPSSLHEMILVPDLGIGEEFLRSSLKSVNSTAVPGEDILTDSLYLYRRESGLIELVPD
ncbi:MAG: hypothetical protein IKS18_05375 [Lachnospiraceae bacterium]|nr:hypothetical protein [Lachnospiraceae bacterium]